MSQQVATEPRERVHFAPEPITLDYARIYQRRGRYQGLGKPVGLWYSAPVGNDGWDDWCKAEDWRVETLQVRHLLTLDMSRILVIRTLAELYTFIDRYAIYRQGIASIDWDRIYERFAGIEIAPYQWERRLTAGFTWYYGWDCASGAVWDLSAVKGWEVER